MMPKIFKLKSMPYAQAGVWEYDDGTIELHSYRTMIIRIDKDGWMECTGTYSPTTRKHIGAFMRNEVSKKSNHPLNYYTAKNLYLNGLRMNIHTGEVEKIA